MVRFRQFAIALPVVAGLLIVAWSVHAQPAGEAAPVPEVMGAPQKPMKIPGIPPFQLLGSDPVQAELKLTDEQKQKLRDFIAAFQKDSDAEIAALRALPPQQQQAKMAELQQASAKRLDTLRTQLEGVLTPEQLTELRQIAFQMIVVVNPQVMEALNVTEAQRKDLEQLNKQTEAKIWEARREMARKTIGLLTPEQQKSLKDLVTEAPAPGAAR